MAVPNWLRLSEEVAEALAAGRPVVALESTLIAQGLPWPRNLETANAAELAVRQTGAVPATIAIWRGRPTIGLSPYQIGELARDRSVQKASRRDLPALLALGATAATTVAATMFLAHAAGIAVFATGGIGGAHRGCQDSLDISADLVELSRTPVLVVCAGAKSILDLPRTLEILETLGVPVAGYRTDRFPAFYVRDSGLPVPARLDDVASVIRFLDWNRRTCAGGAILAQPIQEEFALNPAELATAVERAEEQAAIQKIQGGAVTPFLLARIAEATEGRSLMANQELIVSNARLAGEVACGWAEHPQNIPAGE